MNVIALMAGDSNDFKEKGYTYPKYFLELDNKPLVQNIVESLKKIDCKITFIIRKEDNDQFFLGSSLKILAPFADVVCISGSTKGAVCTTLFAIDSINNEDEVLLINGDQLVKYDINDIIADFRERNLDGGIVTFESVHPRWSYVCLDEQGLVVQTSEKRPISNVATAGIYYYKRGLDLVESCFSVLKKDVQLNGSYYISSTFNELILRHKKVGVYKIDKKEYISFATTQMYENYINKK